MFFGTASCLTLSGKVFTLKEIAAKTDHLMMNAIYTTGRLSLLIGELLGDEGSATRARRQARCASIQARDILSISTL
jgi:hypothetical protein